MIEQRIQQQFFESADLLYQAAEQLARPLAMAAQMVVDAITGGNRILCAGQGLASMDADYLAARLAGAEDAVAAGDGVHHHLRGHRQGPGQLLGSLVEQVGAFEELLLDSLFNHSDRIIVSLRRRPLVTT